MGSERVEQDATLRHGVQRRMISVVILCIFEIISFCSCVAIFYLVHDVETIFHLLMC